MLRHTLFLLCAAAWAQDTRVILLGTGTPNPEPQRMGPAVAVVSGDRVYLVDCGPGVVRRAAQAGLQMEQLTRVFVTHLHSDHTAGYPDLILTPPNSGRSEPLEAYGPPGLRAMTAHILAAWREDLDVRLHGTQPVTPRGFVVEAHDVKPGEVYRDAGMRVVAFAVEHGAWKYAYGYRFEAPDKVIVISGDTTYSKGLIEASKGCDILVHEVYSEEKAGEPHAGLAAIPFGVSHLRPRCGPGSRRGAAQETGALPSASHGPDAGGSAGGSAPAF